MATALRHWWDTISNLGIQEEFPHLKKKRIRFINQLCVIANTINIVVLVTYVFLGEFSSSFVVVASIIFNAIPIILNINYFYKGAAIFFLSQLSLITISLAFSIGEKAQPEIVFLLLPVVILILFSERWLQFFLFILNALFYLTCIYIYNNFEPAISIGYPTAVRVFNFLTISGLVFFLIDFFFSEVQRSADTANQLLEEIQTKNVKIEQREREMKIITDALPACISHVGEDYKYKFNNATYEKWFGINPTETVGKHIQEVIGDKTFKEEKTLFDTALSGNLVTYEKVGTFSNGEQRMMQISFIPGLKQNKKHSSFFVFIEDVTLLKTQEQELKKANEELIAGMGIVKKANAAALANERYIKSIISQMPIILFVLEPTGQIKLMEGSGLDSLNLHSGEMIGQSVYTLGGMIDEKVSVEKALQGEKVSFESWTNNLCFDTTFSPVFDENNQFLYTIGISVDITEREIIQQKLEESNESLKNFAYVASHDLQEPLRMIHGFGQLLEMENKDNLDDESKQYIHFMTDAASRMSKLLNDLLDYSTLGKGFENPEEIQLDAVLEDVKNNLKLKLEETGTKLLYDALPSVAGFHSLLAQLFQNIISNGIKFQKKANVPEIKISTKTEGNFYYITIADNGIGIEEENISKIFGIFNRLHKKTEFKGSGIGLATCKKIVEKHGGKIWVTSVYGEGTTFHFTLPIFRK